MRPRYAWPDPDRDYANGAFIPQADSFPPKWAAAAAILIGVRATAATSVSAASTKAGTRARAAGRCPGQ